MEQRKPRPDTFKKDAARRLMARGSKTVAAPATTFNAAGLNQNNGSPLRRYALYSQEENIDVYQVDDEFLTGLQEPGTKDEIAAELIGEILGGPEGAILGGLAREALAEAMKQCLMRLATDTSYQDMAIQSAGTAWTW